MDYNLIYSKFITYGPLTNSKEKVRVNNPPSIVKMESTQS